ncbi:MAG: PLP-dependent lyase/thiolase [Firmicutes bacterium]|nr:PLP-dependent lyase/thiolase [Dethiobacter sp.]MBS3888290.1 PLP-dependent lyase/thiolase [Bacillota bacterium]MBS4053616.1 PLP-dependent lyase/thiolase [Thermaerobacter sp.]
MTSYKDIIAKKREITAKALGFAYEKHEQGGLAFDYESMMNNTGYTLDEIRRIQLETGVGNTPLLELRQITRLARKYAPPGKGARIFLKDEAANPSGSFKARRAAISVYHAAKLGYAGVVAATSGNYGAAVASQAAMRGLRAIIVQEVYDSKGLGQPEILEKGRACEAYGAEVVQLTVGPELFAIFLQVLDTTSYFNASLYTPYGIAGIETLGVEIVAEVRARTGRDPDAVVITHAGGGNVTGTARGLKKAGAEACCVIGASVDLGGLHMASDSDFNRKSFTTGHTGFSVPFTTWPDRADVPRNAARSLRYLDRFGTVTQGEVFYATEMLAQLEGLERGPAGNVSLAAAFALAQTMDEDQVIVVQETEYTGAGKHPSAQLAFAESQGIALSSGDPRGSVPGKSIIIPSHPNLLQFKELSMDALRQSYLRNALAHKGAGLLSPREVEFLSEDSRTPQSLVWQVVGK